ncbi:BREX system P-loop protein BrxC [Brevundimonas bacteroides]|uniref:BREX system P-loop protein BrxC n=1 Tax=Brevundimonas bacteroides TaxID=74311 RepID=UPI0004978AE1|nr:BREX system P-loop protein BrxC [Brevundimonas bacteroides]
MSKIGSLFANDVTRQIEEVIKVDQDDEAVIVGEIDEYVVTDSIKRHFLEVLERYQETPQKPHEGAAVWVSGFFGSGKSSFAKLLGLSLENRMLQGAPAGKRFADQVGDSKLTVVLNAIGEKIPTHAVIFDVSTDRGIRSGNQMLTEIMYSLFLKSLDYAKDIDLAELEIGLESEGKLPEFEAAYKEEYGKDWNQERGLLAFATNKASLIMHKLDPKTFPLGDSWAKGRSKPVVNVALLGQRVVELMARRKPGHSLVFVVDEVGQFVARDIQKMLDLQSIVQQLGMRGKGRFWTIVTSQERLSELVSGLDDKKIELGRLMDRFPMQVHLEPSDIAEVTSRRVLNKNADAQSTLGRLFEDNRARLDVNSRVTADVRLPELSRERFVDLYPLLPYQIDLIIDVVSGLRTQGGASKHVGGANRTIIKLAQQLLINPQTKMADQNVGELVTLDQVYDLTSGNISSDIRGKIDSIPARTDHPLAQAVAKVVCLLQFVKSVHRTPENIAAALLNRVDSDSRLSEVHQALADLEKRQFVRLGDDGYRIPTPAEDDWDKTREGLEPRRADERQLLATTITDFWSPQPDFTLGETKVFKAGLMIDGSEKVSGDIGFHLQLADDAGAVDVEAERFRTRSQTEKNSVFWIVGLDEDIRREAREAFRSDEMIKRKGRGAATTDETKLIAEERARLRRHQQELFRRLKAACLSGRIYFQGHDRSPDGGAADIRKVAVGVLSKALPAVYERFGEASAKRADIQRGIDALMVDENLNGLPKVFAELGLLKDDGGKRAFNVLGVPLAEVVRTIDERARYGEQATGKYLAEAFAGAPFGWDFDAVRLLVLSLLRAGAIDAAHKGQTIDNALSVAAKDCFNNNQAFRVASFRPRKGIDFGVLAEAADHFKATFGNEAKEISESSLSAEIRDQVDRNVDAVQTALGLLQSHTLPGADILATALNEMRSIGRGGDENAILSFNATHRSIKDAIKRSADLARSLDQTGLEHLTLGRAALRELPSLLRESGVDPGIAEKGETLNDFISRETFFRDLPAIAAAAASIHKERRRLVAALMAERAEVYGSALDTLAATSGWDGLDPAVQDEIAAPLRACASKTWTNESFSQLRSETEACESRLSAAIQKVLQAIDGDRIVSISVGQYFAGGIENEEQLEQALSGLRDELGRLIGEGKKVIIR